MKHLFFLLAFINVSYIYGQKDRDLSHVKLDDFISETQLDMGSQHEISLVWTVPIEFWILSFQGDSTMSEFQKESLIESLRPYYLVAVVDAKLGAFGVPEYTPKDSIEKSLELTIDGAVHTPLNEDYLSPDITILLATFKPILSSMLGSMGENMHWFVFNDQNSKGNRILNLYEYGNNIKFDFLDKSAELKTPVGSLLKKKVCPHDGEKLNGGWTYCPYHGDQLEKDKK